MRIERSLPLFLALFALAVFFTSLSAAAPGDSAIVPFGEAQANGRLAYLNVFRQVQGGGRVQWVQRSFDYSGTTYLTGTVIGPDGIHGVGFDVVPVSGTLVVTPALALQGGGIRVALLRSTVTDTYGAAGWELADVRRVFDEYLLGAVRYDILDEAALATADLSRYAIIIAPAVRQGNEAQVVGAYSPVALANLHNFVQQGGFFYAQGNGAYLAEVAGLVPTGTVNLSATLTLAAEASPNLGTLAVLAGESPLTFSWLTSTLYVLDDPLVHASPALPVVAEFTNLAGPNQPAILSGPVGRGRVVLVVGHPTAPAHTNQLPLFFNAVLWSWGQPAELYGAAIQTYNPALDPTLIPAFDPGATISTTLRLANLSAITQTEVVITSVVQPGFAVLTHTLAANATITQTTYPSTTIIAWQFEVITPGTEITVSFGAQTSAEALQPGEVVFATNQATFQQAGEAHLVRTAPFILQARMAARLQGDCDVEMDRQYGIPREGLYITYDCLLENKEDSLASHTVVTLSVPLVMPLVALDDQEAILSQNNGETPWVWVRPFFYNEANGMPYLAPEGYDIGQTVFITDWQGDMAVFDVPGGTHIDPQLQFNAGVGNFVTIPPTLTNYVSVTADHKLLLPVQVFTFTLPHWPGFFYAEPAIRYGLHIQELNGRKVTFAGDPGIAPEDVVVSAVGGSLYVHLGDHPIVYRDNLVSGLVYAPQPPTPSMVSYQDIWSRTHTMTVRSAFVDIFNWASCACGGAGSGERHAALNVTFGMLVDADGDGVRAEQAVIYPSRLGGADVDIIIKNTSLGQGIEAQRMLVDLGMFKGLGVAISPRSGQWATSWQANTSGTLTVETTSAYNRLLFQYGLPPSGGVVVTVSAVITGYPERLLEGLLKLHDGARFTYHQPEAGPSRYEVHDTHVQAVLATATTLKLEKSVFPVGISVNGDFLYHAVRLDDPDDPRRLYRNGPGDPSLQCYGFGWSAACTYVGGVEQKQILHSLLAPGERTRVRVELLNNTGQNWQMLQVLPQPPAGMTVTRSYTTLVPPPIFPDLPFLYPSTIPDAGRGVYYFDVMVSETYTGPRGGVVNLPFVILGTGLSADFQIPPAPLGIEDVAGRVFHSYGPAQDLVVTDTLPHQAQVLQAALATPAQVLSLTASLTEEARFALFASLTETIPFSVSNGVAQFLLPSDMAQRLYQPSADVHYLVFRTAFTPTTMGPVVAGLGATVTYTDNQHMVWSTTSPQVWVEAHGAMVRTTYGCAGSFNDCLLIANQTQTRTLFVAVQNVGDYVAKSVTATITLTDGVTLADVRPAPLSVTTDTVTWAIGDLGPGSTRVVQLTVSVTPSIQATRVPIIRSSAGQFVDDFSKKMIQAQFGSGFSLDVKRLSQMRLYLPLVAQIPARQADLAVEHFSLTPASPVTGQPATITLVVRNLGNAPASGFWVDFYINPITVPTSANLMWQEACNFTCDGIAWVVEDTLQPGQSLTLTSALVADEFSVWPGYFRTSGLTDLYVYVDSWNPGVATGAVPESNESNNRAELLNVWIAGESLPLGTDVLNIPIPRNRP